MAQNAPGKHYRKGISLIELFERFPNDATAEQWFEERRWRRDWHTLLLPYVPRVTDRVGSVPSRKPASLLVRRVLGAHFSVRTGSVMHRSKVGLQKCAIAI